MYNTYSKPIYELAEAVVLTAKREKLKIALAESCTGGMLSSYITAVPGSSEIFEFGYVAYSNKAKNKMLGLTEESMRRFGVISDVMAISMVNELLLRSDADIGLSITGVAGPTTNDLKKPIGLVYLGYGFCDHVCVTQNFFEGDRHSIRSQACQTGLNLILSMFQPEQLERMRRYQAYMKKEGIPCS